MGTALRPAACRHPEAAQAQARRILSTWRSGLPGRDFPGSRTGWRHLLRPATPGVAFRRERRQHKGLNNRAENSHHPPPAFQRRCRWHLGWLRPRGGENGRRSASCLSTPRSATCSTSAAPPPSRPTPRCPDPGLPDPGRDHRHCRPAIAVAAVTPSRSLGATPAQQVDGAPRSPPTWSRSTSRATYARSGPRPRATSPATPRSPITWHGSSTTFARCRSIRSSSARTGSRPTTTPPTAARRCSTSMPASTTRSASGRSRSRSSALCAPRPARSRCAGSSSEHAWPAAPNIIDQDFTATAPNQKWGVDISYVWTREGWLYLAVIDLFSQHVVGWAVGDRLHRDLALAALRKALVMRRPPEGLIHHSDCGSQLGFNRSSQRLCTPPALPRQMPRRAFSSPGSCAACR